jgi:hypothetical protein
MSRSTSSISSTTLRHPDHGADAGTRPSADLVQREGDASRRRIVALIFASIAVSALVIGFSWMEYHPLTPCRLVISVCGWEPQ